MSDLHVAADGVAFFGPTMSEGDSSELPAIGNSSPVPGLDPLIVEAAKDVDVTLLDWALGMTPRERLRASTKATLALGKFGRATPIDR